MQGLGSNLERDLLQIFLVNKVEGIVVGAVDIEDGDDVAVGGVISADGDDYFAVGSSGAGDVSGELMDVGYDERFGLCPGRAADAPE